MTSPRGVFRGALAVRRLLGHDPRSGFQPMSPDAGVIPDGDQTRFIRRCSGSEPPLPLWERVGVRGYGLTIDRNPSPGSHLAMRRSRSVASASYLRTAAEGDLCSPTRGEVK